MHRSYDSRASRRNWALMLYISLNFKSETIVEFFELFRFAKVAESEMRRLNNICADSICTVNWRLVSLLISTIKIMLLWTKCVLTSVEAWVCWELMTFKDQESSLSSNRFSIKKNEHSTRLFSACLRCWSSRSSNLRSRSQINQTSFFFNFDFLICNKTTTYSWFLACSFTRRINFCRLTNV